jgi:hypothetical protein
MSKEGRLIDIGKSLYDVVLHFQKTYTTLYKVLRQEQNEAIDNFEKEKKGRSKEEQDYIDKKINAFKIVRNKELPKHVDLIRDLNDAVSLTNVIYNNTKILEKDKKQTTVTAETIQEKIEQILPMLERIFSNSDFILKRILKHKAYVLKEQDELKKAGLTFDPQEEVLRSQLENLAAGVKDEQSFLGAFKQARGSINTAHGNYFGGRIATIRSGIKTNWSSKTETRENNKKDINQYLSSATPDSLSSMPESMKKKIAGYMGGIERGKKAKLEKGDPHIELSTEKLIREKIGGTKSKILSSESNPTPTTQPVTESSPMTKALVPYNPPSNKGQSSIAESISGSSSSMTKALAPYIPPASKPSPVSVASALPSMDNVLRQQQGLPASSSSSIYPDMAKLETSPMSTAMVPYHGPNLKQIAATKKLKAAMENSIIPQTTKKSIPRLTSGDKGFEKREAARKKLKAAMRKSSPNQQAIPLRGDKDFEDKQTALEEKKSFWQSANFGQPGGSSGGGVGGGGVSGSSAKKAYNNIMNVRVVEIVPEPLDSLKTVFHSAMAEALDYYSASPKLKVHLESIGNNISQLLSSLFNQGSSPSPGQTTTNPGQTIPNTTNPGQTTSNQTNPGSTGGGGGGKKGKKAKTPIAELDPFQKRLKKIYEEGREEITLLYAKVNSYLPIFTNAQVEAKKTALNTLKEGYRAFNVIYQRTGSSFKGMMAGINRMFKISPATVVLAGMTAAFTGILSAANRLNNKIKEISAELGTSNMQSYEFFKNAMSAQTQYDNMYASLRDVRDVQKGILGDSGILLQVNDKALASIADNAKNIGVSTEGAGAFVEALRTKGATDVEAANLAAASLELADKSKFIMPQSVMEDIAQNVEFSSKYFSNINKDSKSAQKHLVDTNLQVKALGLNFQKAAKMTQHLLSFEQSIVGEVEASVALGRHVNIGKARELLLQDDIGGAMQQMMDTMGGYDEFQNMDFAKRQLMANAVGLEVSELEKSLYLRDKIGITNEEALNAAMKNSDYLDKVAGKDVELYKIEAKKVLAAERFNTAVEKVGVAFKSSLLPILEAIIPLVDHMAWAINLVAEGVKYSVGGLASAFSFITGGFVSDKRKDENTASPAEMASGGVMMSVMGASIIGLLKSKLGGKIGDVVGKARGGLDQVTGTLGSKSNPMYVISLGGGGVGGGILDSVGGGGIKGGRAGFFKRMFASKDVLDRAKSIQKIRDARTLSTKTGAFSKIGQYISNVKPSNMLKLGGLLAVASAGYDVYNRKQQGQSTTQAVAGTSGGVAGGLLGAKGGAILGATLGTAIAGPVGTAVGSVLGGIVGGATGYYAGGAVVDSQFKSNEFKTQPFMYAGMNGMSGGGGISTSLNKPTAKGIPVETSMVDTTPTTLKPNFSNPFNTTPNYGTTSMSRDSVIANTTSKSVSASATIQNTLKEKEKSEEALLKATDYTNKLLENLISKQNSPVIAYFNDEGRRQVKSTLRKESSS